MLLHLTDLSSEPIHKQISRQLIEKILAGDLLADSTLPPARTLARTQHVNVHAVERAYSELAAEELISVRNDKDVTVNALTAEKKHAIAMQMLAGDQSPLNIVNAVSEELISAFEPAKLAGIFAKNLKQHLLVEDLAFAIANSAGALIILPTNTHASYELEADDALLKALRSKTIPAKLDEFKAFAKSDLFDELSMRAMNVLVPLHGETAFHGFIALGKKVTGIAFGYHEMMLLSVLARQFTTALNSSQLYVEMLEKRRMEEELAVARKIQQDLLPRELPDNQHYQIAAYSKPSQTVGGDFYDYLPIDQQRFGLVIADASGKGMPAAMLISQIQAILKSEVSHKNSIEKTISVLNRHLKRYSSAQNFATLFFGMVDMEAQKLFYVNAGHNYPILARENGEVELLQTTGPALGILKECGHEIASASLVSGDTLLLYTDGVTETMNDANEEFGESRLQELFSCQREFDTQAIIDAVNEALGAFEKTDVAHDDRTMVVLKLKSYKS
ncbi:SpoIIE family protein phosphatase [candidate division KSB1 bacterium]|nr:SpoIIE family protein phosphatase [candidate division KSB1 bacterium]